MGMPVEINGAGHRSQARVVLGDCLAVLPALPAQSFDLIFTDPPYPCIERPYGYWTEPQWLGLMMKVVPEMRRVLKPSGSAVFILQPNSERVGRMRTWLWEFMAWVGKEWGVVQDVWWHNPVTLPSGGATHGHLLRGSVKVCLWSGAEDCWRDQRAVLCEPAPRTKSLLRKYNGVKRSGTLELPSGHRVDEARVGQTVSARGGSTPYNLLTFTHGSGQKSAGARGHPAGTPLALCSWWLRYLCPPGGAVLDPFAGTSTVGVAALQQDKSYVGIERVPEYVEISRKRLDAEATAAPAKA
jgi:DNA modification methylase